MCCHIEEARKTPSKAHKKNFFQFEACTPNTSFLASNSNNLLTEGDNVNGLAAVIVSECEVRGALKHVSTRKLAGPEGISGRILRCCVDQLTGVFTHIFNVSLTHSVVPTCLKISIIVLVEKHNEPSSLNDYCPVALTSLAMKVFERLAYQPKRCQPHVLYTTLTHVRTGTM